MSDFTFDMRDVDKWVDGLENSKPKALRSMGNYMLRSTRERYRATKSPDGKTWKPTKHKGKRWVRTLYAFGDLFRSIVFFKVNNNTVGVGTNLPYAAAHQYGYKPKNIPQRKYLGFSGKDIEKLKDIATRWFTKGK